MEKFNENPDREHEIVSGLRKYLKLALIGAMILPGICIGTGMCLSCLAVNFANSFNEAPKVAEPPVQPEQPEAPVNEAPASEAPVNEAPGSWFDSAPDKEARNAEITSFFKSEIFPQILKQSPELDTPIGVEFNYRDVKFSAEFMIHIDEKEKKVMIPLIIKHGEELICKELMNFDLPPRPPITASYE